MPGTKKHPIRAIGRGLKSIPRWLWLIVCVLAITVGLYLLSYVHLLNIVGLDDWSERQQLKAMDYSMGAATSEDLALIYIDETQPSKEETDHDRQARRADHARLLDALGAAPKLVAFDLTFPPPDDDAKIKKADTAFGNAVRTAKTRVIVGAVPDGQGASGLSDSLRQAEWGLTVVGGLRLEYGQPKGFVRRYILAQSQFPRGSTSGPQPATPSIAVAMLMSILSGSSTNPRHVTLDSDKKELVLLSGSVELKRISCDIEPQAPPAHGTMATMPFRFARSLAFKDDEDYSQVLQHLSRVAHDYKGKVLVIGVRNNKDAQPNGEGERVVLAPEEEKRDPAYGYQVHASVFSDLLNDTYPRRLGGFWHFVILLVSGFLASLGWMIGFPKLEWEIEIPKLGKVKVPFGLLAIWVLYFFVVWLLFRWFFFVFEVAYGVLAIWIFYYLGRLVLDSSKPTEVKEAL
jgi:hypothetical protein